MNNNLNIVLVSDNHLDHKVLKKIVKDNQKTDLFLHCGDSQMNAAQLAPFISVKGNNDNEPYPKSLIIDLNEHFKILLIHGDNINYYAPLQNLVYLAKQNDCNIIAYGHTHIPFEHNEDKILILNPGSTTLPRNHQGKTYMKITITDTKIDTKLISI